MGWDVPYSTKMALNSMEKRENARKDITMLTEPKKAHFRCKWCGCEYEAPLLACDKHECGGERIHWWSSKKTPIYYEIHCDCPYCETTNYLKWGN